MKMFVRLFFLTIIFFSGSHLLHAAGPTVVTGDIITPTTWSKGNSPYIVKNTIIVNAPLTIESGVIIKFNNNSTGLVVKSDLSAIGTSEEKIIFTSLCDNDYGGDTQDYSSRCNAGPLRLEWSGVSMNNYSAHVTMEYVRIFRASRGIADQTNVASLPYKNVSVRNSEISQCGSAISIYNTVPVLEWNVLKDNNYGLEVTTNISGRIPIIRDSSIVNNGVAAQVVYPGVGNIDARYNWWGDVTGPYFWSADPLTVNLGGLGNRVVGDWVKFRPWLENEPNSGAICTGKCASNVLFLPGIKTSKLYKAGVFGTEDQLWLPNYLGNDLDNLALDENGNSVNAVYTRDVLDEVPFGGSLYKSFIGNLATLKSNGTINDYNLFAYDWRKNVEDLVRDGTLYPDGVMKSLVADMEALARTSKTRKVTIVAHSNGGLLAKALIEELERRGLDWNIDTVVLVGTPQMGTPLSVLSLLYGYDEGIPTLISRADARTLGENMSGVYGLLPSEEYFKRIIDPLIVFSSENTRYKIYKDIYGDEITDYWGLMGFLGAGDGERDKPKASDVESENVLNNNLLWQASDTHSRLDTWVPPAEVQVIQIAGWGLDTVSGVEYTEKEEVHCYPVGSSPIPSCTGAGTYEPVYEPKFTVDGDAVVVTPSALMLSDAPNVKTYWIDLYKNNKGLKINRKHRDLLEVDSFQQFLSNVITKNNNTALPEFLSISRPDDYKNAKSRLRMSLYSPLDIHLYDDAGNHTGPKKMTIDGVERTIFEESIPNSYYYQFGDRKYVGFGSGEHIRVELDGYALGSYTLKLEEVKPATVGDETVSHTTFEKLPTTADTEVKFDVPSSGLTDLTPLRADINGDGSYDYSVVPVENGVATLGQDTVPPITTTSITGTLGQSGWYTSDVSVVLTASDEVGGSGVEKTEYSLDNGTTWIDYALPFNLDQEGTKTILYSSTDKQGNREDNKTLTVKIDKTAPEAKITFNPVTQKLDIIGSDNLSQDIPVVVVEQADMYVSSPKVKKIKTWFSRWLEKNKKHLPSMLATITDEAGHTTSIVFEKTRDRDSRLFIGLKSIAYDDDKTVSTHVAAQYKWQIDKKNQYRLFATHMKTDQSDIETHYIPKKNETWIMEKSRELADDTSDDDSERRPVRTKLSGMVIPYLQTEKGTVKINTL